jgi:serine protease
MALKIIDSGLAWNHPDINCIDISSSNTNCIGAEFGLTRNDGRWYSPVIRYHGTHVAGTVGATALNKDGVSGVINNQDFCFLIGRVFGETSEGASMSSVLQAIEWMVSKGAKVINMSLGSPDYSKAAESITSDAFSKGTILIASSGNSGTSTLQYPASYPNVISVAAVDANRARASFSQYNSYVDLSAPGVDILSTYPMNLGGIVFMSTSTIAVTGDYIKYGRHTNVTGTLVSCTNFGQAKCPGPGKHLCLIQR